ncbi:transcriptional regulator, TetR family [Rhizobiales bacterium GAS191]|nr:transcriptional regulator, TetR family [Rhizobiales bacterium GAS113]SEE87746.1 transcriptional regulator, TetR family [Rhizobiales bacterium GAS191]
MARKPTPQKPDKPQAERSPRDRIIEALMELAAEKPYGEIGLAEIAARASVTLGEFRDLYPSKGAILGAFSKRIDRIVLDGTTAELAEEPARERVLDVMMRRFDALHPYRDALRSIARDLRRDPLSLAAMNQVALNSQRFMLTAAGIDTTDALGQLKLQGAVAVFARAFETFLHDDEPDLARTMARLDKELDRGERLLRLADDVHALSAPFRAFFRAACRGRRHFRDRMRERMRAPRDADGEGGVEAA